jgi:hypothetical protein
MVDQLPRVKVMGYVGQIVKVFCLWSVAAIAKG